jgi:hypothetical protein
MQRICHVSSVVQVLLQLSPPLGMTESSVGSSAVVRPGVLTRWSSPLSTLSLAYGDQRKPSCIIAIASPTVLTLPRSLHSHSSVFTSRYFLLLFRSISRPTLCSPLFASRRQPAYGQPDAIGVAVDYIVLLHFRPIIFTWNPHVEIVLSTGHFFHIRVQSLSW